jgi:hypothetical protein
LGMTGGREVDGAEEEVPADEEDDDDTGVA